MGAFNRKKYIARGRMSHQYAEMKKDFAQTKTGGKDLMGYVYILNIYGTDYYKIGITRNPNVQCRISQIQTGNPFEVIPVDVRRLANYREAETYLHTVFSNYKVRGEWFYIGEAELLNQFEIAVTMFTVDEALADLDDTRPDIAVCEPKSLPVAVTAKDALGITTRPFTVDERDLIISWLDENISRREMSRRIYFNRGGKSDYRGDGPISEMLKIYLDSLVA